MDSCIEICSNKMMKFFENVGNNKYILQYQTCTLARRAVKKTYEPRVLSCYFWLYFPKIRLTLGSYLIYGAEGNESY